MLSEGPFNQITQEVIGAAIDVHRALGPGLLESVYVTCLERELREREMAFVRQKLVPILYKGALLDATYRVDLIVEGLVLVEVKAVESLLPVHQAQTLTYLSLTECPVALLINFNVTRLKDGLKRFLNSRTQKQ